MNTTKEMRELTPDESNEMRELTPDEFDEVSGGLKAMMVWGSNVLYVNSDSGLVLVSSNGGKSGTYSSF